MSLNISMTIKSLNFIIYFHNSLINLYWTNFKYGVARVDTHGQRLRSCSGKPDGSLRFAGAPKIKKEKISSIALQVKK